MSAPTVSQVAAVVAEHYGLPLAAMRDPCRKRSVARPRQVAMFLARRLTDKSRNQIGRVFNRDQSTVFHAIELIDARRRRDAVLNYTIAVLSERLSS